MRLKILLFAFILNQTLQSQTFTLKSQDIGGQFTKEFEFKGFGCSGNNQSPQLYWENTPEGTKSFAITMYDPDAPTGSGFWHWIVFDIPSNTTEILRNAGIPNSTTLPQKSIQSITNYGIYGYGGPCPPENHGIHQYIITIHALKVESLGLSSKTNPAIVGFYLWQNTIAKSSIVAYYKR